MAKKKDKMKNRVELETLRVRGLALSEEDSRRLLAEGVPELSRRTFQLIRRNNEQYLFDTNLLALFEAISWFIEFRSKNKFWQSLAKCLCYPTLFDETVFPRIVSIYCESRKVFHLQHQKSCEALKGDKSPSRLVQLIDEFISEDGVGRSVTTDESPEAVKAAWEPRESSWHVHFASFQQSAVTDFKKYWRTPVSEAHRNDKTNLVSPSSTLNDRKEVSHMKKNTVIPKAISSTQRPSVGSSTRPVDKSTQRALPVATPATVSPVALNNNSPASAKVQSHEEFEKNTVFCPQLTEAHKKDQQARASSGRKPTINNRHDYYHKSKDVSHRTRKSLLFSSSGEQQTICEDQDRRGHNLSYAPQTNSKAVTHKFRTATRSNINPGLQSADPVPSERKNRTRSTPSAEHQHDRSQKRKASHSLDISPVKKLHIESDGLPMQPEDLRDSAAAIARGSEEQKILTNRISLPGATSNTDATSNLLTEIRGPQPDSVVYRNTDDGKSLSGNKQDINSSGLPQLGLDDTGKDAGTLLPVSPTTNGVTAITLQPDDRLSRLETRLETIEESLQDIMTQMRINLLQPATAIEAGSRLQSLASTAHEHEASPVSETMRQNILRNFATCDVKHYLSSICDNINQLRAMIRQKIRQQDETKEGWVKMEYLSDVLWALDSAFHKARNGAGAL